MDFIQYDQFGFVPREIGGWIRQQRPILGLLQIEVDRLGAARVGDFARERSLPHLPRADQGDRRRLGEAILDDPFDEPTDHPRNIVGRLRFYKENRFGRLPLRGHVWKRDRVNFVAQGPPTSIPAGTTAAGPLYGADFGPYSMGADGVNGDTAMIAEAAIGVIWSLWLISWILAARWADPAARRPAFGQERLYRILTVLGVLLMVASGFGRFHPFRPKLWYFDRTADWALVAIVLLGLLFVWWARLYLGRLWSNSVTRKADHRVVDTGPYAIVRHPIYTGLIVAIFASAAMRGTLIGLAGAVLLTLAFVIKARLEERFLRDQLGAEAYDSYRRRVPMLIPFGPKSH
jgi:protein-S-isoprenylcysteine O-methyltransferase Ste14